MRIAAFLDPRDSQCLLARQSVVEQPRLAHDFFAFPFSHDEQCWARDLIFQPIDGVAFQSGQDLQRPFHTQNPVVGVERKADQWVRCPDPDE